MRSVPSPITLGIFPKPGLYDPSYKKEEKLPSRLDHGVVLVLASAQKLHGGDSLSCLG